MALKITAFVNSYLLGLTKCSSSNVSIYPINNMADPEQVCLIYKAFHATSLVLTSIPLYFWILSTYLNDRDLSSTFSKSLKYRMTTRFLCVT